MKIVPRIWPETASRRQARAVLCHLVHATPADTFDDLETKLALYDALGDLDAWLPSGALLAPVEPRPGTVLDAYRLLVAAIHEENEQDVDGGPVTARDRVATGLATRRLRVLLESSTIEQDALR